MARHFSLTACAIVALSACTPSFPRAPTLPSERDAFGQAQSVVPSGIDDDAPSALSLEPGDVITLVLQSAEREEQPNLVVDERGVVHVPLAGDVEVGGMPLTQAEQRLETALRQYDRTVRVSILLADARGHVATVIGAVQEPGRFAVTPGMRLTDLLAEAGGPARNEEENVGFSGADLGGARLVRRGETMPVSVTLALNGDPRHNVRVRPGDVLYVPADLQRLVTVLGQVTTSQVMPHRPGMRITQSLALAGGLTRDGNWGDVRVIRGDSEHPRVYQASVADIVDGRAPDVVLAPGDIVYVASAGHADLRDVMTSISAFLSLATTGAIVAIPTLITSSAAAP
ncbi:MAG: SLBB domain-containing protein [Deltaproteobacteria bacterium]|nr:SLBB domain-containing protein [Deltaproteobacteria bacterium]